MKNKIYYVKVWGEGVKKTQNNLLIEEEFARCKELVNKNRFCKV